MIDAAVTTLAKGKNFAALTTLMPSGQPQTHVMWVDSDDDHVLINTELGRQKHRNVERDPGSPWPSSMPTNPYNFVEVRGRVVEQVRGEAAARPTSTSWR